jgi:hypothetical protein
LEVELLEGRLCPSFTPLNITDPSQLPLQLPGTFSRGQHIQFIISAKTNDTTENTEGEAEYLTLTSSTGDLNLRINLGETRVFDYTVIQRGETFTLNSSDGDEIGMIVYAVPQGSGKPGSAHHPLLVTSDFWNWQKLFMMSQLQQHIKGGPNDPFPNLPLPPVPPKLRPLLSLLPPGYANLASVWDNPDFHGPGNQVSFTFQDGSFFGRTLTGHEVNYYFQGMVAAAYGLTLPELEAVVVGYYKVSHGKLPPLNVLLAANQGFAYYLFDLHSWQQQTHGGKSLPPEPLPPIVDP